MDLENLAATVSFAARYALGQGHAPADVAQILEDIAHAVREPQDVAESMRPITLDDLATL